MIHVYTGMGKGKTTAALGLALRALGWGRRVCIIQFLKGGCKCGELKSLAEFENCECLQFGRNKFLTPENLEPFDYQEAENGLARAEEVIGQKKADILILDEVNFTLHLGLLPVTKVKGLLQDCPQGMELILTGRHCPDELMEIADYVSDIKEVKHPYQKGIGGREGIEY